MNVEFHYYSTAFLAVKAGFSLPDATTVAYASQYVDHHHRSYKIMTRRGTVSSGPTQNYSFWDPSTVNDVLAPFHFFPAGLDASGMPRPSVRNDGARSAWEVRPDAPGAKKLLVDALRSANLCRIGLALHTYSDTWAHQNFTARNEPWNRLDAGSRLPSPGHAQAGSAPDLWLTMWTDPRLLDPEVVNLLRFSAAARKVYRYLCTFKGKDFRADEEEVAEELKELVEAGRGRDNADERSLEFILNLNLEPYDRNLWTGQALEPKEETPWPTVDHLKKVGEDLLHQVGLVNPEQVRAKANFDDSLFAAWVRAADEHRALAKRLIQEVISPKS